MMKRLAVAAASVCMGTIGLAGVAGAAKAPNPITSGSQWTIYSTGFTCEEVLTFTPHHFTGSQGGDAGTYTGGKTALILRWKAGEDRGAVGAGEYANTSGGEYELLIGRDGYVGSYYMVAGVDPDGGSC